MGGTPYWWEAAPLSAGPWPPLPAEADVAVIGSGFTGLAAALTLARGGRRPLVLDAGAPGFGASTRNGGQVGSGNQKFRVKTLIARHGERKAVALLREGVAMLDGIEQLIRDEAIACDFVRCGRFRGAMRPSHYEAMARDMEDLRRFAGVAFAMVPKAGQRDEIGTDLFQGGAVLPDDASLHPGRYHAGLLARVEAAGGVVIGGAAVEGLRSDGPAHELRVGGGTLRARDVIVATNGYTAGVGRYLGARVFPVLSAQIATAPLPQATFDELFPRRRVYGNSNRVFFYFRPAPGETRIVFGGRGAPYAKGDAAAAYGHLSRDLLRVFPHLGEVAVSHAWSGRIGYTFDEFPHLGRTAEGVHYALGYCGTGVSRSTHFGRKIALQLMGRREGATAFDDMAFPSHPLHAFAAPAVPAVVAWKTLQDAIDR